MSRRASLPGAAELFRSTGDGGPAPVEPAPSIVPDEPAVVIAPVVEAEVDLTATEGEAVALRPRVVVTRRAGGKAARAGDDRKSTGRERHEEKITVYVSSEELFDLEHARLVLRGEHGLAIDRGRIVREALSVVLADLEAKGAQSILVRRLREG
jgi:hypothetical protein